MTPPDAVGPSGPDALRYQDMERFIMRAVGATAAERLDVADDQIAQLVADRDENDLFGILYGIAQYGRNIVTGLNSDDRLPAPPDSGQWAIDHIRPRRDSTEPALRFAEDFLTACCAPDDRKCLDLFNAMLQAGNTHVVATVTALVRDVAHAYTKALELHLDPERRSP